jgi:hypothetical protein
VPLSALLNTAWTTSGLKEALTLFGQFQYLIQGDSRIPPCS